MFKTTENNNSVVEGGRVTGMSSHGSATRPHVHDSLTRMHLPVCLAHHLTSTITVIVVHVHRRFTDMWQQYENYCNKIALTFINILQNLCLWYVIIVIFKVFKKKIFTQAYNEVLRSKLVDLWSTSHTQPIRMYVISSINIPYTLDYTKKTEDV